MIVMSSLRVRCPWRTRWCWLLWSRRCRYRGSNHLQKSSISQNMAMSWLIGTSVGFRLHLGRYSHHTPVLMGLQAPPAYPEFRLSEATCPNPTKRLEYSTQNFSGFSAKFLLQYIFL